MHFQPRQWLITLSALIFVVAWYVFITTAPISITFEDGGELATEPYILGCAHPSGQPLFTVLGKIITLVPLGPISWRTNLYSSLASAVALVLLFLVFEKLGKEIDLDKESEFHYVRLVIGVCVCLFTLFGLEYWLQSILTEVYALNALMFIGIVYLALIYQETGQNNYLYLLGLAFGLSLANHHTTIFALPALIYLVLDKRWTVIMDAKTMIVIVCLAVFGLSLYLELPLRSANEALVDWGDPQTMKNFMLVFLRKQYKAIAVARSGGKWMDQLMFLGFSHQQTLLCIWLSLVGIAYLALRLSRKAIFLLTMFVFYTIGFIYLINPSLPRYMSFLLRTFYLPAYMMVAIMTGMGLLFLMELLYHQGQKRNWQLKERLLYFSLILLLLPALPAKANYKKASRRYYYYTYDYVRNMLMSVKPDSVLFTLYAQDTFPLWYAQYVEGRRPDVVVIHQRLFVNPWFRKMTANFHPDVNLKLKSARKRITRKSADILQAELIALNHERPFFASQYCSRFKKQYNLLKKGAVYEFRRSDRDYRSEIDPRSYYVYRSFVPQSKFFQMEMRALEVARDSYLSRMRKTPKKVGRGAMY